MVLFKKNVSKHLKRKLYLNCP